MTGRRPIGVFIRAAATELVEGGERSFQRHSTPPPGMRECGCLRLKSPRRAVRPPRRPPAYLDGDTTPFAGRASRSKGARLSSARLDLAPLVVHRDPDHLPDRWRPLLLRRAQAQRVEDALGRQLAGDVAHDLQRTSAASAHERVRLVSLLMSLAQLGGQRLFAGAGSAGRSDAPFSRREVLARLA